MPIMNNEQMTATYSTDCACTSENFQTGEFEPSETCFGDCGEWQEQSVQEVIDEWIFLNKYTEDTNILITCDSQGWTRSYKSFITKVSKLPTALSLKGEFRIEWELKGSTLTARRYSHDEPTGTGEFQFSFIAECVCAECDVMTTHATGYCIACLNNNCPQDSNISQGKE